MHSRHTLALLALLALLVLLALAAVALAAGAAAGSAAGRGCAAAAQGECAREGQRDHAGTPDAGLAATECGTARSAAEASAESSIVSVASSAGSSAASSAAAPASDDLLALADMGKWSPIRLRVPSAIIDNERVAVPALVTLWLVVHMSVTSLLPPDSPTRFMWANHLTAIIHCVVSLALAVPATLSLNAFPTPLGAANSDMSRLTLLVSLGYFVMDLGMGTVYSIADAAVMLHHVACVAGMSWALWTGSSGAELVTAIAISEITIPPHSIRWMIRHAGLRETLARLYAANDVLFFVLFVLFRVVIGLPFTVYVCLSPAVSPFIKGCAVVILAVSVLWFSHILTRSLAAVVARMRTGSWPAL